MMFALFAFGYLFGFVGLLIAGPLAAARQNVIGKRLPYKENGKPGYRQPVARPYERSPLIGLHHSVLIGVASGLLSFIPYLGSLSGLDCRDHSVPVINEITGNDRRHDRKRNKRDQGRSTRPY